MTAKTHDLAAITALGIVVLARPLDNMSMGTVLLALFANQVGGIAPDIDQPTAPFWRNLPVGRFFGKIFGKLSGGHRFLSHSVLGLVLFGLAASALLHAIHPLMPHINIGLVWWAFMIGVLSHLVMDSFTHEGVPWLLPIPFKFGFPPLRRLRITTGKSMELLIILPGLFAFNIWLYSAHYAKFASFFHHYLH